MGTTNLFCTCQRKQNMTAEISTCSKCAAKTIRGGWKDDSRFIWWLLWSSPSLGRRKNYLNSVEAVMRPKVINERCITTPLDVAKVHSPIALNESKHPNTSFAIQNLERSMWNSSNKHF